MKRVYYFPMTSGMHETHLMNLDLDKLNLLKFAIIVGQRHKGITKLTNTP